MKKSYKYYMHCEYPDDSSSGQPCENLKDALTCISEAKEKGANVITVTITERCHCGNPITECTKFNQN